MCNPGVEQKLPGCALILKVGGSAPSCILIGNECPEQKNTTHTIRTFASFLFSSSSLYGYVLGGEWRAGGGKGAMHIFLSLLPSVAPLVAPIWTTTSNTPTHFPGKPCILVHFDKYGGSSFGQIRKIFATWLLYICCMCLLHLLTSHVVTGVGWCALNF